MSINVEIERNPNESNANLVRRFTRKVQASGVLPRVRGNRYKIRNESPYKRKKRTLKSLTRKIEVDKLIKLGKMTDKRISR